MNHISYVYILMSTRPGTSIGSNSAILGVFFEEKGAILERERLKPIDGIIYHIEKKEIGLNKHKKVKWFKEGELIPIDAKLIEHKTKTEKYQPPGGGYAIRDVSYFLYEFEVGMS